MKIVLQFDKKFLLKVSLAVIVSAAFLLGIFLGLKNKGSFLLKGKQASGRYGETVELSGTLTQKQFYGAPGYGQNPREDEKETCDILVLDKPIKVFAGSDKFEKPYEAIKELQIINEKGLVLDSFYGQSVSLEGKLVAAQTGHHHTDVLLSLEKITSASQPGLKKETKIQEEKLVEPTLKSHTFKTAKAKEFTFNYSNNLDLIEATGYMLGSRVRLKPKGENFENSYLISVDEPATELGENIYISWKETPVKFGNNLYKRGDARQLSENNQIVMVIFNPLPPLNLWGITVVPWNPQRLDEALQEATIILKTLKETQ